jgi:hypothetical protein
MPKTKMNAINKAAVLIISLYTKPVYTLFQTWFILSSDSRRMYFRTITLKMYYSVNCKAESVTCPNK